MLILRGADVEDVLRGRENEIVSLIASAYRRHDAGETSLPPSTFLRFPGESPNRIIALPAYLGGDGSVAGVKWVASFPENIASGLSRACAVIVLNSMLTGRPEAFIEGSLISARRTAASAALAAAVLTGEGGPESTGAGLIGCGIINAEVLSFLAATRPGLRTATVFDISLPRAQRFAENCASSMPDVSVTVAASVDQVVAAHDLLSIATTASEPYLTLDACRPGTTVLHISLRDLTVATILGAQNVVDDSDHVCRERTSVQLAEQHTGGRAFINASIGAILREPSVFQREPRRTVIFSPFGLGVLDMALAKFVYDEARQRRLGLSIEDFLP